MRVISRISPWL